MWGVAIVGPISPPAKCMAPALSIPGFYVPRWGAYQRGSVRREHARWDEDFAMVEAVAPKRPQPKPKSDDRFEGLFAVK